MPAFTLIVLDRTHHPYGVKCPIAAKPSNQARKPGNTQAVMKADTTAPNATKPYGVDSFFLHH